MRIHFVCVCFNGYPDPAALSMCIRIRILNADPDPGGENECGSGSTALVLSQTDGLKLAVSTF